MAENNKETTVPSGVTVKKEQNNAPKKRAQPLIRGTRDLSAKSVAVKQQGRSPKKIPGQAATSDTVEFEESKLRNRNSKRPNNRNNKNREDKLVSEFEERVLDIARVTTVVKGGRRFSFSAYVVIGNRKGKVGFGHGKANEVPDAIKKAVRNAQTHLITVPIIDKHTIAHDVTGKYLSSRVLLKPAPKGKGIIASGTVRTVTELAGYSDIYSKSYGSRTKMNTAKATIKALEKMRTVEQIAELRDVSVEALKSKVA
ncbi:30S ribosomal protein S5 [Mycoplasmopsis agassizii]|uniref:Small ribosomal subunit protein uS5 n=1 Tax=Mycoplasmopsis agassizii TaxID=33922 RepID=A0A1W1X2P7_9BACT|nr:30S ribosomal protein S5 [Mycoplasmopsis agassizii]PAK21673.1 30S ribosomal protein S5 [Mycoplasmopsis agassizii]SMC18249.1 SSU ribosomal protein S5P [Mycoplasmopsis agassizii]